MAGPRQSALYCPLPQDLYVAPVLYLAPNGGAAQLDGWSAQYAAGAAGVPELWYVSPSGGFTASFGGGSVKVDDYEVLCCALGGSARLGRSVGRMLLPAGMGVLIACVGWLVLTAALLLGSTALVCAASVVEFDAFDRVWKTSQPKQSLTQYTAEGLQYSKKALEAVDRELGLFVFGCKVKGRSYFGVS